MKLWRLHVMKTSNTEQWNALWRHDIDSYDATMVLASVEEERAGVRCHKITEYLEKHIGDLTGKRTIEIGCGGAIYSMILAGVRAHATLLDYSPDALKLAERNFGALNLKSDSIQADAFNLPPGLLGRFDVAMSFGTVEHYRYPQRMNICRAHVDLLRPGGVVIISTPNILFLPHEILKILLSARGKWFLGYEGSFSRREMQRVGRMLGLREIHVVGSSWLADLRRYVGIVRNTRSFKRWFPLLCEKSGGATTTIPQAHHYLDDFLGHDIALLGVKA